MNYLFSDKKPISSKSFWIFGLLICLLGIALRTPGLQDRSLWIDEAYSYFFATRSLSNLWHQVPLYETHPPLYYTFLHGWINLFGSTESAMRSLSVVASTGTIILIIAGAKWLKVGANGEKAALIAAVFLAVNKGSIQYAQQARPYAFETLASEMAILASLLILQHVYQRRNDLSLRGLPYSAMVALAIGAGFTLWFHNTAVLIVFSIWVGLVSSILFCFDKNKSKNILIVTVPFFFAGILWSPFIPFLLLQSKSVITSFWIKFSWVEFLSAWVLVAGGKLPLLPMLVLCALGFLVLWRFVRFAAIYLAVVLLLPFVLTIVISYAIRPIYIQRLFEWMCPEIMVLAAIGIVFSLSAIRVRQFVFLLVVVLSFVQSVIFYRSSGEDWRGTVKYIAEHYKNGDVVIVSPNEAQSAVDYYVSKFRKFPDIVYVPAAFPTLGMQGRYYPANLGAPSINESDRPLLENVLRTHKRVWLMERGPNIYDKDGVVVKEISSVMKETNLNVADLMPLRLFE